MSPVTPSSASRCSAATSRPSRLRSPALSWPARPRAAPPSAAAPPGGPPPAPPPPGVAQPALQDPLTGLVVDDELDEVVALRGGVLGVTADVEVEPRAVTQEDVGGAAPGRGAAG